MIPSALELLEKRSCGAPDAPEVLQSTSGALGKGDKMLTPAMAAGAVLIVCSIRGLNAVIVDRDVEVPKQFKLFK